MIKVLAGIVDFGAFFWTVSKRVQIIEKYRYKRWEIVFSFFYYDRSLAWGTGASYRSSADGPTTARKKGADDKVNSPFF